MYKTIYFKTDFNLDNGINKFIDVISRNEDSDVFLLNYLNILFSIKLILRAKKLIFNFPSIPRGSYFLVFLILILKAKSKRVLVIHEYNSQSRIGRLILMLLIFSVDTVYCVDNQILDILSAKNIKSDLYVQAGNLTEIFRKSKVNVEHNKVLIFGTFSNFDIDLLVSNIRILLSSGFIIEYSTVDLGLVTQLKNVYGLDILVTSNVSDEDLDFKILESEFVLLPYRDGFSLRRSTAINCLVRGTPVFTTPPQYPLFEFDKDVLLFYAREIDVFWYKDKLQENCRNKSARQRSSIASKLIFKGGKLDN